MKLVILIGSLIIFISTILILFIMDILIKANVECVKNQDIYRCDVKELSVAFMVGLICVGFFVLIDFGAVYLMVSAWI